MIPEPEVTDGTDGERATGTTGSKPASIIKLYIMKFTRPRGGEENGLLKRLHGEFSAIQAEIKAILSRLNDKRVSFDLVRSQLFSLAQFDLAHRMW